MSLQLVLGGSGSGKSHWLYSSVIRESMENPHRRYVVVVPEQFTMETQRELVELHPAHGILNIDVLSFQRLAYRVFEETGTDRKTVLTETGKNLLLRLVAARKKEELGIMGGRLNQPGYLSQIKSMLSELMQYQISEGELDEMIRLADQKPQLQYKLKDLRVLEEGFREYMQDRFITAEELLTRFCQAAPRSGMLKNCSMVFDGFTGFTPVQLSALETLLKLTPQIRISVTLGAGEPVTGQCGEHELFYLSRKTAGSLLRLARKTGTQVLDPVVLDGKGGRFRENDSLAFLEKELFRYGKRETWKGEKPAISIWAARNPMEEVRLTASLISRMTRERGIRFREIGVIAGDLSAYESYVRNIFAEYQIPCFVDQTVQILFNPCLEFIRGAFAIADENFSYTSVFRFLRTGFAGLEEQEIDRLENYVLALGIRGKKRWEQEWTRVTDRMDPAEPEACSGFRDRLMEKLSPWIQAASPKRAELREYGKALYELLTGFQIQQQLRDREQAFRQAGQRDRAEEYGQIYGKVIELLDEAVELLGDETVSRREFEEILEAGFSEARVGMIPPGIDQVHLGDMKRTRLGHIRVLFFLGLNDGWVPSREKEGGIITQQEREFLAKEGIELAPTARENSYIQRFYLYLALTRPSGRLYLSFCKNSGEGRAMRPSYLINVIRKMFPQVKVRDQEQLNPIYRAVSPVTGFSCLAQALRTVREEPGEVSPAALELLRCYLKRPDCREKAKKLLEAAFWVTGEEGLQKQTSRQLYGEILENSVTRLERFAACPFAHFAVYGLKLGEREIYQVRSADLGNIFHRALELFSGKLERSSWSWSDLPDETREEFLDEAVKEAVKDYGQGVFFDSARNKYMIERAKRILGRTVWAVCLQVRAGKFVPAGFEVSFQAAENLRAVNISLGETERMRLKGRIDRIDLCCEEDRVYVKVVDYKSGSTSFDLASLYDGLQLQLVVYLNAAMEMEKRLYPDKEIVPAGIFYCRLQDPLVEADSELTPAEIDHMLLKKMRPDGLVNLDPDVISRLDGRLEKTSLVIPVGVKKDGTCTAASSVAPLWQIEELSRFVSGKLEEFGRQILDGQIQAKPCRKRQETACDYCAFSHLCGFDPAVPGASYREQTRMSREEIWKEIEKEEQRREP